MYSYRSHAWRPNGVSVQYRSHAWRPNGVSVQYRSHAWRPNGVSVQYRSHAWCPDNECTVIDSMHGVLITSVWYSIGIFQASQVRTQAS